MTNTQWHYAKDGVPQTPVTQAELSQLAAAGNLRQTDLVWCEGMPQWMPAASVPGLFPGAAAPPPLPAPTINYYAPLPGSGQNPNSLGNDPAMRLLLPVGRSVWAIIAGYLGLFSFVIFPAPLALIVSIIAIVDMKKHPDRHGMGRAIFGLIMGIPGTIILVFLLCAKAFSK